eukprot:scaffold42395_cov30-Tisochrysis_lutea.AAC.1
MRRFGKPLYERTTLLRGVGRQGMANRQHSLPPVWSNSHQVLSHATCRSSHLALGGFYLLRRELAGLKAGG